MNSKLDKRKYDMTARAQKVSINEKTIINATYELWLKTPIQDITLEKVSEKSGVTVRTLIRKYGSKIRLIEACIDYKQKSIMDIRYYFPYKNYESALLQLLKNYEDIGDAAIRTLEVEQLIPTAAKMLEGGRKEHRKWCQIVFESFLPQKEPSVYEKKLIAFIAATDLYLWKLLRRDLKKSFKETYDTIKILVDGIIKLN